MISEYGVIMSVSPPGEKKALEILESALEHGMDSDYYSIQLSAFEVISKMEVRTEDINKKYSSLLFILGDTCKDLSKSESNVDYLFDALSFYKMMYNLDVELNNEPGMNMALLMKAGIYSSVDDYSNLERICKLYDSSGLGDDRDPDKYSLWDAWKAIVEANNVGLLSDDEGDSDCFIATAAYGTPFDPKIDVLRNWRDDSLRNLSLGRLFIRIYYFTSPPVANVVAKSGFLRLCVRVVISPIIYLLKPKYDTTR